MLIGSLALIRFTSEASKFGTERQRHCHKSVKVGYQAQIIHAFNLRWRSRQPLSDPLKACCCKSLTFIIKVKHSFNKCFISTLKINGACVDSVMTKKEDKSQWKACNLYIWLKSPVGFQGKIVTLVTLIHLYYNYILWTQTFFNGTTAELYVENCVQGPSLPAETKHWNTDSHSSRGRLELFHTQQ